MADNDTRQFSLDELRAKRERGETRTAKDAPAYPVDESFWENAEISTRTPKVHTGLRLDADMLEWFKGQGRGWQTRMNDILRTYYKAHRDGSRQ